MNEHQARTDIVKFFEIVAPLSRRILVSKPQRVPAPHFTLREDKRDAWERLPHESIMRWLTAERGTAFRRSSKSPLGIAGAAGCFSPELNLIWMDDRNDEFRQFAVLAHEGAHALTYDDLHPQKPRGQWARMQQHGRSYNIGEIIAETTSFLVTKQVLHHTTAHSPLYVASYAAKEQDVVRALSTALPFTLEATLAITRAMNE
jgi:hypothetical protein